MNTATKRNEGGRYSSKNASAWYAEIEAANIQAVDDAERALTTALATQVGNAVAAMPEAAARITKAAALVQAGDVYPLTSGSFLVGSQSAARRPILSHAAPGAASALTTPTASTCANISSPCR